MDLTGIKIAFLERAVKWITSGSALDLAKMFVLQMMNEELTGAEKRAKVQELLKPLLTNFSSILINLLIEVAVLIITNEMSKTRSI